jgi:hypothetical protein
MLYHAPAAAETVVAPAKKQTEVCTLRNPFILLGCGFMFAGYSDLHLQSEIQHPNRAFRPHCAIDNKSA